MPKYIILLCPYLLINEAVNKEGKNIDKICAWMTNPVLFILIPSKICILIGVAVIKKDIVAYPIAAPTTAWVNFGWNNSSL